MDKRKKTNDSGIPSELATSFKKQEKEKLEDELIAVNKELDFQNDENKKQAAELTLANEEINLQNKEKDKRAAELVIANKELVFQQKEKKERAAELIVADKELTFQKKEKKERAAELIIANKELAFQKKEKKKRAAELIIANKELAFQEKEKKKRAAELVIANKKLLLENKEKSKRIAELSKAKAKLEKKEVQCKSVLQNSPNAMLLLNKKGLITFINKQAERILGYKEKELLGSKLEIFIPEISSSNAGDDLLALKKDGSKLVVEVNLTPIEMLQGPMILTCINDITERKTQETFEKKQIEQETKNKETEQFAYITSHNLQEPLRTVSNYMYLLEKDYVEILDVNALTYIHSINNATKRMNSLIKSILNFSRLGQLSKKKTFVDCRKVIDEVLSDLNALIKASDSVIEIAEMPELNVYETEFRQLFQNLITNAIKFCKKGDPPVIKIFSERINEKWKFSVCDNGIGIAPVHFKRVFDIFQRLNHEYEGHGIGLANCKKIVQLHQGEIWLESVLGEGTKFHFTIPN